LAKENLLNEMGSILDRLSNQARFVLAVINGKLVVAKRKKTDIVTQMRTEGYKAIPKLAKKLDTSNEPGGGNESEEEVEEAAADGQRDSGELGESNSGRT